MSTTSQARPASVTTVSALVWIAAIIDLVLGAYMIWLSYNPDTLTLAANEGQVRWYGLMSLVIGAFTAAVAAGIAMGSQGARVLVMIVMGLRLAAAVWALTTVAGITVYQAGFEVVIAIVVLALLSTRAASAYFRGFRAE